MKGGQMPHGTLPATLSLVLVTDQNGNGQPNYGDSVRFAIDPPDTAWDYLALVAYQPAGADRKDQVIVGSAMRQPAYDPPIGLSSGIWQSGAADVVVQLSRYGRQRLEVIGEVTFTAAA